MRSHANEIRTEFATEVKDPKVVEKFVSYVVKVLEIGEAKLFGSYT